MFSRSEVAQLLDVEEGAVRSQTDVRTGLLFDPARGGDSLSTDDVLALALLRTVQDAVGKTSPAAKEIVRQARPFFVGVLDDPRRTFPSIAVPLIEGDTSLSVQVRVSPAVLNDLREKIAELKAGERKRDNDIDVDETGTSLRRPRLTAESR